MQTIIDQDRFHEGYMAGSHDESEHCPYNVGTPDYVSWSKGFIRGQEVILGINDVHVTTEFSAKETINGYMGNTYGFQHPSHVAGLMAGPMRMFKSIIHFADGSKKTANMQIGEVIKECADSGYARVFYGDDVEPFLLVLSDGQIIPAP